MPIRRRKPKHEAPQQQQPEAKRAPQKTRTCGFTWQDKKYQPGQPVPAGSGHTHQCDLEYGHQSPHMCKRCKQLKDRKH
jgi:hypothetical protein